MAGTINKTVISVLIFLAMATGFLSLIGDIETNYNVVNTTSYVSELSDAVDVGFEDVGNFTGTFQGGVESVEEVSPLGLITSSIVGALLLPFKFIYIIFKLMVALQMILGLPQRVAQLLSFLLEILIAFAIFKIIMRTDKV